jgi:oleandomycin transport system permease protein
MTTTIQTPTPRAAAHAVGAATQAATPGAATFVRHVLTLAKRSLIKTWRTPEALIDVTLQPIIFLLMFTFIFGGAIAGGSQHDYLQFVVPSMIGIGIAMAGVAIGQNLNADIEKGVFDRFRSLPISRAVPLVGAVSADVVRYLISCAVTLTTAFLLGFRIQTNAISTIAAVALAVAFALCFCWISVWVGMKVRTPGAVQGIMFLLVLPLSFVSNAYVPTSTMPSWMQPIADANPLSHLASAMRGLMLGGPVATDVYWTLGWMAVLLIVFVPLALRGYRKRA